MIGYGIIDDNVFFKILQNCVNLIFTSGSNSEQYDTLMGVNGGQCCDTVICF